MFLQVGFFEENSVVNRALLPHIVNVELAFSQKRPETEGCFPYLNVAG